MLKIKDNVDLEILHNYGFVHIDGLEDSYTYHIPSNYGQKKDLHINKYGTIAMEMYEHYYGMEIPDILYDLIKADLVEKVDE